MAPALQVRDLAWAAGILDGEGSFGIYKADKGKSYQLTLAVASVDDKMCPKLHDMFGGHFRVSKRGAAIWRVIGRSAAEVIRQVLPYLVVKRDQAEVCLEFADTIQTKGTRNVSGTELCVIRKPLYDKLRKLHASRPYRKDISHVGGNALL